LTQNEIDAAKTVKVSELNVQNQQKFEWPAKLAVAKAYLDQLSRSQALPPEKIAELQKAIQSAASSHASEGTLANLKSMASSLEKEAGSVTNKADATRLHVLAEILGHPSA
jgi:chromosome segregation ATPase